MAQPKKKKDTAATSRQAKIQAAQKSAGSGANRIVVGAVVVIVAIVVVVGGVIWMDQSGKSDGGGSGGGTAVPAGTAMGEGYRAFPNVTVQPGAPTVDIFEDFQCPACGQFEQVLGGTVEGLAQDGKIELRYHVKTFLDDSLRNDSSMRAGNGAFCAAGAGKFLPFHNAVYANQPAQEGTGWTEDQLRSFAEQSGITGDALDTWTTCQDDMAYQAYLESVEESSSKGGVNGTPTVQINGEVVELAQIGTPELLTQAVQAATKS